MELVRVRERVWNDYYGIYVLSMFVRVITAVTALYLTCPFSFTVISYLTLEICSLKSSGLTEIIIQ